jgi:hypothetical protein
MAESALRSDDVRSSDLSMIEGIRRGSSLKLRLRLMAESALRVPPYDADARR